MALFGTRPTGSSSTVSSGKWYSFPKGAPPCTHRSAIFSASAIPSPRRALDAGEPVQVTPGPVAETDPLEELPGPRPADRIGLPRELERQQQILLDGEERDQVEQGGLAGTASPHEDDDLAGPDGSSIIVTTARGSVRGAGRPQNTVV